MNKFERKCKIKCLYIRKSNPEHIRNFQNELVKQTWADIYETENDNDAYDIILLGGKHL